jgi:Cu+-exporting ATPase
MKKIKLSISGMHCASCASNIEHSISKVAGVKSCNASAITNKAIIECEDNTSTEELQRAVSRTGYKIVKIE